MTKRSQIGQPVYVRFIAIAAAGPFIGCHADPGGRLPEMLRYPGESPDAFCSRALHHVTGTGPLSVMLMYPSERGPMQ